MSRKRKRGQQLPRKKQPGQNLKETKETSTTDPKTGLIHSPDGTEPQTNGDTDQGKPYKLSEGNDENNSEGYITKSQVTYSYKLISILTLIFIFISSFVWYTAVKVTNLDNLIDDFNESEKKIYEININQNKLIITVDNIDKNIDELNTDQNELSTKIKVIERLFDRLVKKFVPNPSVSNKNGINVDTTENDQ